MNAIALETGGFGKASRVLSPRRVRGGRVVQGRLVTVGPTRGDQIAILKGLKAGDEVVTSGQLKLKTGTAVTIDNKVQPLNEADPRPTEE
ncbi:hypothetical protein [Solimonas variicoloris]|uniref:hypothetical protein n=1 Tax=Solimonas variicoloris TaxID=254408 RepID=UPI001B7F8918|nr:hypothetical protein [Solimonas variicoloris]